MDLIVATPTTLTGPDRAIAVRLLVTRWLEAKSPATVAAYRGDLDQFGLWMGAESGEAALGHLLSLGTGSAHGMVIDWANGMKTAGLSPRTRNRRLTAIKSITGLARMTGLITWRIEVRGDKTQTLRDTKGPGVDGVRAMIEAIDGSPVVAARASVIVRLMYTMGLRRGEICEAHVRDYRASAHVLSILGKGKMEREDLTVPAKTAAAIDTYLALRGNPAGNEPLLVNLDRAGKGEGLTGRSVARIIDILAQTAGIEAHVRPHGLRHAAITAALDETNGNVRRVAAFSRHADVRTVSFYDDKRKDGAGEIAAALDLGV